MQHDVMAFRQHTLSSGMRLLYQHRPLPFTGCRLMYHAGARQDPRDKREMMHLLEHLVGADIPGVPSRTLTELQSWIEAQGFYAMLGMTTLDATSYDGYARNPQFEQILNFLHTMTQRPSLMSQLDKERDIIRREREEDAMPRDRKTSTVRASVVFGDDPADRSEVWGEDEDLNLILPVDVRAAHHRWYRPANASLIVVGGIDEDTLLHQAEQLFLPKDDSPFTPADEPMRKSFTFRQRKPYWQRADGKKAKADNVQIRYMWYMPPVDEACLRVTTRALYLSLTERIRERMQMTYGVDSETVMQSDFHLHFVAIEVAPRQVQAVRRAIEEEVRELASFNQLDRARNKALLAYRFAEPDIEETLNGASDDIEALGRIHTNTSRMRRIECVSANQVRMLAEKHLTVERAYVELIEK